MPLLTEAPRRRPNRKRATITISLPWALYDRLDTLAIQERTSIARVIQGLLSQYDKKESENA